MPEFGDYETLGDPLFIREGQGQVRTYWTARNWVLRDCRLYLVKSVALAGPGPVQANVAQANPAADPSADFFAGISRLQEAFRVNPAVIAPIYASGKTDAGFWYATDYCPWRSLAELESSAAEIDSAALEHVVYSLASACLALQRATGYAHGNLKNGNVLLACEPAPLRLTPLHVIDPAGSAFTLRAFEKGYGWPIGIAQALMYDAIEIRDLRCIGEIILKLVEGNPIRGPEDYSLPIEPSASWQALGKNSKRWLQLCNRLLDPELALDAINLKSLAKEFKPKARPSRTKLWLTGFSVILLAGGAAYTVWNQKQQINTWVRKIQRAISAQLPDTHRADSSMPVAAGTQSPLPASPLEKKDPLSPQGMDLTASSSAKEIPATSQPVAPLTEETNAVTSEAADRLGKKVDTGSDRTFEVSPKPAQTASSLTIEAPATGAPAGSSSDSVSSTAEGIQGNTTEMTAQTAIAEPMPAHSAPRPLAPSPESRESRETNAMAPTTVSVSRQLNSGASSVAPNQEGTRDELRETTPAVQTTTPNLEAPPSLQGRQSVEQSGSRQTKTDAAGPSRAPEHPAKAGPTQARIARAEPARNLPTAKTPTQPSPIETPKQLDEELRQLETKVNRAVVFRRNSELFAEVNLLEARYVKANCLSRKIKKRLELLRANMAKKTPGVAPDRDWTEPFILPLSPR